ncbi:MAG: hypothetical protein Q7J54_08060 [Candidatus Woesearchaeota archaeon]|nr:hypothetical protein [Candidatus Woesearchaeota archaeon]
MKGLCQICKEKLDKKENSALFYCIKCDEEIKKRKLSPLEYKRYFEENK